MVCIVGCERLISSSGSESKLSTPFGNWPKILGVVVDLTSIGVSTGFTGKDKWAGGPRGDGRGVLELTLVGGLQRAPVGFFGCFFQYIKTFR